MILEREEQLGGILNQCIHNGFGLHTFNEELTGPEYADRFISMVTNYGIPYKLGTTVIDVNKKREITYVNARDGVVTICAGSIVLAMGCRERPRGALLLPGFRPAGIYTAGTAQRLMNIEGLKIGKEAVILGSGDIGLIMARRLTLEGVRVKLVAELMPYSAGLKRNIVQCLDDFEIPLKLGHTVTCVHGKHRLTGVTISEVGSDGNIISGTEEYYDCDILLLSCGLLPENELSKKAGVKLNPVTGGPVVSDNLETTVPGVFCCGNVLHVHDLVDYVSEEAEKAGREAAEYIRNNIDNDSLKESILIKGENGVRYTVPQLLCPQTMDSKVVIRFRVADVYKDKCICVYYNKNVIRRIKKRVMTPGEMEQITISKDSLSSEVKDIIIQVEE